MSEQLWREHDDYLKAGPDVVLGTILQGGWERRTWLAPVAAGALLIEHPEREAERMAVEQLATAREMERKANYEDGYITDEAGFVASVKGRLLSEWRRAAAEGRET